MKNFRKSWQLIALIILIIFASACDKDDPAPTPDKKKKDILMGTMLPNPDGFSGSAYMQLIKDLSPAKYDNKQALTTSYAVPPVVRGNDVYVIPGWSPTDALLKKYTLENGILVNKGEAQLPPRSGANAIEINGKTLYVSYSLMGKIGVFDKDKLTQMKEIDITSYGIGDENPDPCQMVVRDGILYVALNQTVGANHMPDPKRAKVDILLIDLKTDKVIKMITQETANMSMPTKPEADDYSMFIDEKGDIYINCMSGFGFIPSHDAGFLRIKKGETDFDNAYQFKVNTVAIEGEVNKASYVTKMHYAGNGKVYATVTVPAYYSKPKPDWFKDRVLFPVEIDLNTKTIKRLGKPVSNNFGFTVGLYKDKVIFGLSTTTDNGFFVYDPTTKTMSNKAVIETTGYPYFLLHIKDN